MAYDNEKRGVAWFNDYKKNDSHPSFRGTLVIDGVEYKQSVWVKVDKNGKKMLSMSYEKSEEASPKKEKVTNTTLDDLDDEIPF
jgi:hypothetical protein